MKTPPSIRRDVDILSLNTNAYQKIGPPFHCEPLSTRTFGKNLIISEAIHLQKAKRLAKRFKRLDTCIA